MNASSEEYELADVYRDLRGQALELGAETIEPRNGLFALLMETGYEEAVATVVATADGGASLYFSNGGGIIGAGEYEQVRGVVFETLSATEQFADQLDRTASYPLPKSGETRFYVIAEQGVLTAVAPEDRLGNEKHDLSPLFHQVHKLIAYIRTAEELRRGQETQ
ncbi:MAG: hypothetical protein ACR2RD_15065 [Woeseiaceae bacterium]